MQKIAIITNSEKKKAKNILPVLSTWLENRGIQFSINQSNEEKLKDNDLVIALGGDGTILKTARLAAPLEIPVLGINLGKFGFLSKVSEDELYVALNNFLEGEYSIEERILLESNVVSTHEITKKNNVFLSLNDIVIKNAGTARVIRLKLELGNKETYDWVGDGLIVSTPTGSTAYSLAAFGPIVYPTLPVIIITPICPHSLSFRSLVIPSDEQVSVYVKSESNVMLSIDGQEDRNLYYNDIIQIKQAKQKLKLVCSSNNTDYFQKLRKKLKWGEQ